jgi:FRG domain
MINELGTFTSVSDLVEQLEGPPPHWQELDEEVMAGPRYRYPFGLWFRGEDQCYPGGNIVPGVFRVTAGKVFDETSMFNVFRLRAGSHRKENPTTLDWLCLMQHYGLPTRLIDWSESPLVALYFAVLDEAHHGNGDDGFVYTLDARRLNRETDILPRPSRSGIHVPESLNAMMRAECSDRPILASLFKIRAIIECDQTDSIPTPDLQDILNHPDRHWDFLNRLRMPTAVYPFRAHGRMIAQYSLFTVHGGRMELDPPRAEGLSVGRPIHLEEVNEQCDIPVLWAYRIPSESKPRIKGQLERLGIHEGTLYPDIEQQASYAKRIWQVAGQPGIAET